MLHFSEKDIDSFSEECSKLIDTPITCIMIMNISIPAHFDTSQIITKLELLKLSCTNFANHYSIVLVKSIETNKSSKSIETDQSIETNQTSETKFYKKPNNINNSTLTSILQSFLSSSCYGKLFNKIMLPMRNKQNYIVYTVKF